MIALHNINRAKDLLEKLQDLQQLQYQIEHGVAHDKTDMQVTFKIIPFYPAGGVVNTHRLIDPLHLDGPVLALLGVEVKQKIKSIKQELTDLGVAVDTPMHIPV